MNKKLLGVLGIAALLLAGNFAWQEVKEVDAAYNVTGHFYFEKPSDWTDTKVILMIGHSGWSAGYEMTPIANTDLYYYDYSKESWGGATEFAFFNTSSVWGGEDSSISHRSQYATNSSRIIKESEWKANTGSTYYMFTNKTGGNAWASSYSEYNVTLSVTSNIAGGTVSVSGHKLSDAKTSTKSSGNSASILTNTDATLTATVNEGYEFNGWYDAETGGNLVSSELTCTVKDVTEAKTYYARYTALETQETLSELLTRYFNSGSYTRNTTINLTPETMNELVSCFHAGNIVAERTTVFEGGALWMKNEAGTYSYYGTSGSNMTGGRVANVGDTVNTIAYTGKTMEEFYTTLCDIKDVDVSKWTQTGNVWTSDDATVIQQFLDFTAPCFLGLDNERAAYFTLSHVEVEETEDGLELRLVCSSVEEGKFEEGSNNVLSKAVITYEE